jgi:UPF0755 protein
VKSGGTRKPRRGRALFLFATTALLAGVLGYWTLDRYLQFADMPVRGVDAGDIVLIETGDNFAKVLRKLHAAGIPSGRDAEWQLLARQLGAAERLQVGEYALQPGTTPRRLLLDMREGKVIRHRVTIVEGWTLHQLRNALARSEPLEHDSAALDGPGIMKALGDAGTDPEGRFLPETYLYTRGDSDLDILRRAHDAMQRALDAEWTSRAKGLPLHSASEALVLASIVEKETAVAAERPMIAAVFLRRLALGMKLQTDPTVIYGMGADYAGNIRRADLARDTPYNTYTRAGLPPTPIAMPGAGALHAATHPAPGDALYFVAVGDGSGRHVFSRTLAEHQQAVNAYLKHYRQQRQ